VFARVSARGVIPDKPDVRPRVDVRTDQSRRERPCQFLDREDWVMTPVSKRSELASGDTFSGPAIVEQMDTTTLVPPGFRATVDAGANLILEDNETEGSMR